jgi:stringent starvation protein B
MTSSRPYLLRGLYDWICDNGRTAYIVVDANQPYVQVPGEYVDKEGRIVLNISPDAIFGLKILNSTLEFSASFSGVSRHICTPISAIQAIYAQENGLGMVFGDEPGGELPPDDSRFGKKEATEKKKSHLSVVK